ncbi:hypothetical protein X956_10050 [Trueperella pyogenes TP8]|nr:hypothetical protein X956_10050 [Trueperella pyogenes TP8]
MKPMLEIAAGGGEKLQDCRVGAHIAVGVYDVVGEVDPQHSDAARLARVVCAGSQVVVDEPGAESEEEIADY